MKIAIITLAIYAYVVYASEQSDRESEAKHEVYDTHRNRGLVPYNSRVIHRPVVPLQPRPQLGPAPRRRYSLLETAALYLILRSLRPTTTTTPPTTTTATTTTTESTTANPFAGWTQVGACYYLFPEGTATWSDANSECENALDGSRLAVTGFKAEADARTALIDALDATDVFFWIGATGIADYVNTAVNSPVFTDGTTISGLNLLLAGGASTGDMICGRIAEDDPNNLIFFDCVDVSSRYMCENCP